jgi:O-antigen ligase
MDEGRTVLAPTRAAPAHRRQGADATTLLCLFLVLVLILPSRLVLAGLSFNITPAQLLGLGLGLWWFCAQQVDTLGAAKGRNPVRTAFFAFLAANIATYGYATWDYLPHDELKAADRSIIYIVGVILVGIVVVDGVRSRQRLERLLRFVVGCTTIVAAIGLLQFFADVDVAGFIAQQLPGLRPQTTLDFILRRSIFRRPAGTTGHPIEFGMLMAMVLPIAAHFAFRASADRQAAKDAAANGGSALVAIADQARRRALFSWLAVTLIAMSAAVSVSRSAILGIMVAAFVLLPTWPRRRRVRAIVTAFVFTIAMRLVVPGLIGTILSLFRNLGGDPSVQGRTQDYATASAQIDAKPWLGRGFGTYLPSRYGPLDNQYLGSLVETGLIGMLTFILVMFAAIYAARSARRASTDPDFRDLAQSLVASVVVVIVGSVTYDQLGFAMSTGLAFVLFGVCGVLYRLAKDRPRVAP